MLSQELVRKLKDNSAYVAFENHILQEIGKLNSIQDLGGMTNEMIGEEVKARVRAMEILGGILSPLINFSERKEISIEHIRKAKDKFAL